MIPSECITSFQVVSAKVQTSYSVTVTTQTKMAAASTTVAESKLK